MALEYFPCYFSYRKKLSKLSDQEVGRLFRALLEYGEIGETKELTGRESVAFDFIADDIDRAKAAYEEKCETNRRNRQGTTVVDERQQSSTAAHKTKDKSETKTKNKTNSPKGESADALHPLPFETDELKSAFSDWLMYMSECGKPCVSTGLKCLENEVCNSAKQFGEASVAGLIRQCMAAGWQNIVFERLEKGDGQNKAMLIAPVAGGTESAKRDMERMRRMLEQTREV